MKKTYWWRILLFLISVGVAVTTYLIATIDQLDLYYSTYNNPILYLAISLFLISPTLFLVSDRTFRIWAWVAIGWFFLAALAVAWVPEYQGGWLGLGPTKESVSVWMSVLFLPISLCTFLLSRISQKSPR